MPGERDRRRARSRRAAFVGLGPSFLLGLVLFLELALGSFVCTDSADDLCAWRDVLERLPLYVSAVGVIVLVIFVVRRATR